MPQENRHIDIYSKEAEELIDKIIEQTLRRLGINNGGLTLKQHNDALRWAHESMVNSKRRSWAFEKTILTVITTAGITLAIGKMLPGL